MKTVGVDFLVGVGVGETDEPLSCLCYLSFDWFMFIVYVQPYQPSTLAFTGFVFRPPAVIAKYGALQGRHHAQLL